jgi:PAS domain S-box-containing protein
MAGKDRPINSVGTEQSDGDRTFRRIWRREAVANLRRARGWARPGPSRSVRYSSRSEVERMVKEPAVGDEPWDARRKAELEAAVENVEGLELLQQVEARYRIISELISDFAYVARLEPPGLFTIEWVSDQVSRIFGYPADQMFTSDQWLKIVHPEDRQVAINSLERSAQGESVANDIRFVRGDGTIIWLNISARPVVNPASGRVEKIFGAGLDITERKLAEEALAQSQARYHILFDESPVPLWEIDLSEIKVLLDQIASTGVKEIKAYFAERLSEAQAVVELVKIIDVNRAAVKLYSQSIHNEVSAFIGDVIRDDAYLILEGLEAVAEGRTYIKLEGIGLGAAKGARYTEIYLSVVHGYEQTYGRVIVSALDLTGRYLAEQALRQEARRLELLNTITSAALSQNGFKNTLLMLAEALKNFSGADDCFISRWDAERQIPVLLAATGDIEQRLQGQVLIPGEPNITRTVLEAGHVLLAQPDDSSALNLRLTEVLYRGAALAMPLQVGNENFGAAVLVYKKVPIIYDEELDLWKKVAAQVSLVVSSLQHYERARRRTEGLEKLVQVSSELRQAQAYQEVMDITVREMAPIVAADRNGMIVKRHGKWVLEGEKTAGDRRAAASYPIGEAAERLLIQSSHQLIFADPGTGVILEDWPWQRGLDALAVIPIQNIETIIGMVVLGWNQRRALEPGDWNLLTAVAEMAGNALQRASVVATLEKRVADRTRNLKILYDLSALSNRPQELRKLIRSALKQLIKVMGGEAGFFYQLNLENQMLEISVSFELPAEVVKAIDRIPFTDERRKAIEPYNEPLLVQDLQLLPLDKEALSRLGHEAAILIPIRESGQVSGVMCIVGSADRLNLEEKSLAMAVADLLATAADNAQLQKRSNDAAVMEERQRLARALHDSVTQSLYSLKLFTEAGYEHYASGNQERTLHYLERSSETAHRALREMRMLLYELRPPELARLGLVEALRYRLESVERRLGMEAGLTVKHFMPLAAEVEDALFWIAQESLNNTLRHANASKVSLILDAQPQRIMLAIVDNGCGFAVEDGPVGGMGLLGMRERARTIGARLEVVSSPGRGTRVDVKLRPGEN